MARRLTRAEARVEVVAGEGRFEGREDAGRERRHARLVPAGGLVACGKLKQRVHVQPLRGVPAAAPRWVDAAFVAWAYERAGRACAHRLKGSSSLAARKASSSEPTSVTSRTGAEKPRSTEGSGRSSTPSKVNVCSSSVSSSCRGEG